MLDKLYSYIVSEAADPQDPLNVAWRQLIEKYYNQYREPQIGGKRFCFIGEKHVYEVPHNFDGMLHNEQEAKQSTIKDPFIPIAECEIILEMPSGIPVLKMEKLERFPKFTDDLPDWVGWVDCGQVGYNAKNQLVAFDL